MLLSVLLWIRTWFGAVAMSLWGLFVLLIAWKTPQGIQAWTVQFLGVQAIVSTYHQREYLFLPYWFWATLIIIVSSLIFWVSLNIAYGSND